MFLGIIKTPATASHASHEACELKSSGSARTCGRHSHASHEACELKCPENLLLQCLQRHASHEACELKFLNRSLPLYRKDVTPRMRRVS